MRSGTARPGRPQAVLSDSPSRWSEERVAEELQEFLGGRSEWPSYRDFQRQGKKALRDAVTRLGGARLWAGRLGVAYVERSPGYAPIWTEDRIEADLSRFLEGRRVWPSRVEFERAGFKTLRDAIGRTGGPPRWAAEFGLPRRDERRGSRRVWTDERIEAELRDLVSDTEHWPSTRVFRDAGKEPLLAAVCAHGGAQKWSRRLELRRPGHRRPARERVWTDERVFMELKQFCDGRESWPLFREFESAGKGRLYRAASRHGGVGRWKLRLGLS
jgi:hypothetical protein